MGESRYLINLDVSEFKFIKSLNSVCGAVCFLGRAVDLAYVKVVLLQSYPFR